MSYFDEQIEYPFEEDNIEFIEKIKPSASGGKEKKSQQNPEKKGSGHDRAAEKKDRTMKDRTVEQAGQLERNDFNDDASYYAYCLSEIRNSKSYKAGLAITWLPRKVRSILASFNK